MVAPDWFLDPLSGRRAPQAEYCFSINHRDEGVTGNVKQVWELSRHHHLTVLAAAYALTGDRRYAERAGSHLQSWWEENPFLSGIHWTSGIELGIRLISWVWIRRLLDGWDDIQGLFDQNELAHKQIWWHQTYLSGFRSRGSSANNHVVAEAAGQLVAALAFPWFGESTAWADESASLLQRELANNTFPSGVNREMAFDYHGLDAESRLTSLESSTGGDEARWVTEHYGYRTLDAPVTHRRTVEFHGKQRLIEITDEIDGAGHPPVRLAFHLGPTVQASLDGCILTLRWQDRDGGEATATMTLPPSLGWSLIRGTKDPVLGWYSPAFGQKVPATDVIGVGSAAAGSPLRTRLAF